MRSVFFSGYLFLLVNRLGYSNIVILDWFRNFTLIVLCRKFLRKKIVTIYAPLISDYGWLYKRVTKAVPSCGLRYDWFRLKGCSVDYIYCKLVDKVVVQSEDLATFYSKVYHISQEKISVNYNYFPSIIEAITPLRKSKVIVGFVGNAELHKGLSDMIEVVKILPEEFQLIIVGKTKGRENRKLFNKLLKTGKCVARGSLGREDVLDFYKQIDCLLLLSYHEGSPRVITEFFHYNKPIFAYYNPGLDYLAKMDGVFLYKYGKWRECQKDLISYDFSKNIKRSAPAMVKRKNLKTILASL